MWKSHRGGVRSVPKKCHVFLEWPLFSDNRFSRSLFSGAEELNLGIFVWQLSTYIRPPSSPHANCFFSLSRRKFHLPPKLRPLTTTTTTTTFIFDILSRFGFWNKKKWFKNIRQIRIYRIATKLCFFKTSFWGFIQD